MPLHVGRIWKHSEGRWNRHGEYARLYTALTRFGALAELEKSRHQFGTIIGPRDLVSIDIAVLEPILDLTDSEAYQVTSLAAGEAPNPTLMTTDGDSSYEHCRRSADQARLEHYTGLRRLRCHRKQGGVTQPCAG